MSFSVTLQYQETISYTLTNNISETKKKKSQTLLGLKVHVDLIYGKVKKKEGKAPYILSYINLFYDRWLFHYFLSAILDTYHIWK